MKHKHLFSLSKKEKRYLKSCAWEAHDDTAVIRTPQCELKVTMLKAGKFKHYFLNRKNKSRVVTKRAAYLLKQMEKWLSNTITDADIVKSISYFGAGIHGKK